MMVNSHMIINEIHDLTNERVCNILRDGLSNISEDYLLDNYSPARASIDSNIFYILENGRYVNGAYYVIEDSAGKYVCSAGWNMYDNDTALVLTRAYVSPEYRTAYVMAEYLLPLMIESCSEFKNVWITCNKYNKAIYNWFYRAQSGKRPALFANWPEIYSRFSPIGLKTVYGTEQYVVQLLK